jgi:hypothetical protein
MIEYYLLIKWNDQWFMLKLEEYIPVVDLTILFCTFDLSFYTKSMQVVG